MKHDHRAPVRPVVINLMATYEPSMGWSLVVHRLTPSEPIPISDRTRYQGLSHEELADVIEATSSQALRTA